MKMKKSRKTGIVTLFLSMMMILAGCQLAVEEGSETSVEDRLIGALITTDSMSSLWGEQELTPEMFEDMEDGALILEEYENRSEGVLYAIPSYEDKKYVFEGIDGYAMFVAVMHMEEENETYSTSVADPEISDLSTHITAGDVEKIELTGTIYFSENRAERPWHMNPVYQKENGVVYAVPGGMGFSMGGETGEGTSGSTRTDQALSYTDNGETKSFESHIEINYTFMYAPSRITVVEMNADNQVLIRREYEPGKLPEEMGTNEEAEYLIIETEKAGEDGKAFVEREIVNKGEESFASYYEMENGIISKMMTTILWRG